MSPPCAVLSSNVLHISLLIPTPIRTTFTWASMYQVPFDTPAFYRPALKQYDTRHILTQQGELLGARQGRGVWQPEPASCFQHQVTGDDLCNSFDQDTCACTSPGSGPHMCPPTGTLWIYPNIRPGSFTRPGRRPAAAGCRFPKHPAHLSH